MADRNTLMLLEAIRLEIRALAAMMGRAPDLEEELRVRADKLARMSFDNTNLAIDEREVLGLDVEPTA